ncbi:hypothetical protein ACPW96_19815 [Micromonospora sp. DT81.3]|uniref:sugar ABC transporter ATPase n=1 Tax=Actinomycetes TaxID=1760 RepID=UPI003CE96909
MTSTPEEGRSTGIAESESDIQPLRDGDTSIEPDAAEDPAQAEWDRTTLLDAGVPPEDLAGTTATGDDPDEIPDEDDEIPSYDLPTDAEQPESQGLDPVIADLGEEGEGDLSPNDY